MNLFKRSRGKLFGHVSSLFFCISVLLLDVSFVFLCIFILLASFLACFPLFSMCLQLHSFRFPLIALGWGKSLSVDPLLGDVQGEVNIPDR